MFTEKNIQQIKNHGLSEYKITNQLNIFKQGIPFANVVEAASPGNGIAVLSKNEQNHFASLFESQKNELDLLKFVPASGAATRMFQFLHCFLERFNFEKDNIDVFLQKEENKDLKKFFSASELFAFSDLVTEILHRKYPDFQQFETGKQRHLFVKEMLEKTGLNLNETPKGLVPFHKYGEKYVTAFGEQLYEAAFYATSKGVANLHFTVSAEHEEKFKKRYEEIKITVENKTGVKFNISYSFQKNETDTIAATLENEPFFDENNDLVFRPSGHGALLENLNDVDADLIFIKNIDNVVSENYVETIAFQKKVLAGKLISLQQEIFEFVEALHSQNPSEEILNDAALVISKELSIKDTPIYKEDI